MSKQTVIVVLLLASTVLTFCTPLPPLNAPPPLPHQLSPVLLPQMTEVAK